MSNEQIAFQFLGWSLLIYLHNRTLRRAEMARLKESLIVDINDLSNWMIKKLSTKEKSNNWLPAKYYKPVISPLKIESILTAKVVQLDLKLRHLNQYSRIELLPPELFSSLHDIDISELIASNNVEVEMTETTAELIEEIEKKYANKLFNINYLRYLYLHKKPEILGALTAIFIVSFGYHLIKALY